MTEQELSAYIQAIRPADEAAMEAARRRQAQLAKPPGSLGQLEEISIRLAGVTGQVCPAMGKCRVAVFAADNGVVAEGVSCTPPAVTLQQAVNMTFRKTGMSAMAAAFGDDVSVVDVGIDGDVPPVGVLDRKVRRGTGDIAREDAMTRAGRMRYRSVKEYRRLPYSLIREEQAMVLLKMVQAGGGVGTLCCSTCTIRKDTLLKYNSPSIRGSWSFHSDIFPLQSIVVLIKSIWVRNNTCNCLSITIGKLWILRN